MIAEVILPVESDAADQAVEGPFGGVRLFVVLDEEILVGVFLVAVVALAQPVLRVDVILDVSVGGPLHFEGFLAHSAGEVPFGRVSGLVLFDVLLGHPALAFVALDFDVDGVEFWPRFATLTFVVLSAADGTCDRKLFDVAFLVLRLGFGRREKSKAHSTFFNGGVIDDE